MRPQAFPGYVKLPESLAVASNLMAGKNLPQDIDTKPTSRAFENFWRMVDGRLSVYGNQRHGNLDNPLDELIFIILSAQTESYLYNSTFLDLKSAFHPWELLLNSSEEQIAKVIWRGGLARKKASQLKGALHKIFADQGCLSLDFLHDLPDPEVMQYLTTLPGIGVKSAACVMMYSLRRQVFPVDTHVWRVSRRLGVADSVPKPTAARERALEETIPPDLRYRLHVNLLSHGQQTCTTYWPKCSECVLTDVCVSSGQPDTVWSDWRRPRGVWAKAVANGETSCQIKKSPNSKEGR